MSMTREEAIERIKDIKDSAWGYHIGGEVLGIPYDEFCEIMDTAISALRPVSREQVEKVFPGCDFCEIELDDYPYIVAHSDYSSSDTCYEPSFCPICGKPMTDKAVQMVMERWEALQCGN